MVPTLTEMSSQDTAVHVVQVSQLWVYPIKACRGHQVQETRFDQTCLQYDRAWCIVDLDGTKYGTLSDRKTHCHCHCH